MCGHVETPRYAVHAAGATTQNTRQRRDVCGAVWTFACARVQVYCVQQASAPEPVPVGWYSLGYPDRKSWILPCPPGSYCNDGVKYVTRLSRVPCSPSPPPPPHNFMYTATAPHPYIRLLTVRASFVNCCRHGVSRYPCARGRYSATWRRTGACHDRCQPGYVCGRIKRRGGAFYCLLACLPAYLPACLLTCAFLHGMHGVRMRVTVS